MKVRWKRIRKTDREIYYFDSRQAEDAELCGKLLHRMIEEVRAEESRDGVVFLCIGTDRSTGDSLGPLIGSKLAAEVTGDVTVIGTLEHPVHAVNLDRTIEEMEEHYPDAIIVAVDAAVGRWDHVGLVTLEKGPLRPGLGVRKELTAVGDISITGIVGGAESGDPLFLQSIRLSQVMRLADCISRSICLGLRIIGRRVENFSGQTVPF